MAIVVIIKLWLVVEHDVNNVVVFFILKNNVRVIKQGNPYHATMPT